MLHSAVVITALIPYTVKALVFSFRTYYDFLIGGEIVNFTTENIFNIFKDRLTRESLLLFTTVYQHSPIAKEELWKSANQHYRLRETNEMKKDFIASRYVLDLHIARLEGAGLVDVKIYGRIRTYSISPLGQAFWSYINQKQQ